MAAPIELVIRELATILGAIGEFDNTKATRSLAFLGPLALIFATLTDVSEVVVPGELICSTLVLRVSLVELGVGD